MRENAVDEQKRDLEVLIRSRYPVIYLVSWEEKRVLESLREIGARLGRRVVSWSCLSGLVSQAATVGDAQEVKKAGNAASRDPLNALREAAEWKESAIFIFNDFSPYLAPGNHAVIRAVREIAQDFTTSYKTVILLGTHLQLPPALEKDVSVVDFPLPGTRELGALLDAAARELKGNAALRVDADADSREEIIKAAQGLTLAEAESVFARSLVVHGRLGVGQIPEILREKRQIIRKSGLLDYFDATVNLGDVGGLDNLKQWLAKRRLAFSDRAAHFGLPAPRGVLLLGVQGCGKSLCAKAVSALWQLPLLRLDVGRIFNSMLGGSEENIRRAIGIAEGVAPCILWVDEIDKAFGGLSGASTDGGTSQRVLGTFLTWLAEKDSAVFVAATANNVAALPPELLRKGRFDEIFFVDLPCREERENILSIQLRRRGRDSGMFAVTELAAASEGFSGAELEQAVISGLFDAFSENGREVVTADILRAIAETVPLSRIMEEEIARLREWCRYRTRPASPAAMRRAAGSRLAGLPYAGGIIGGGMEPELPCVEGEAL
ncbi:MAG: AAA family ATPase [Planctomycetota bacterium]|jgi:AAA+ superfamily predicted ATPase|nr:AAA family ATPase [Planctomycetota bacterium]